MPAPDRARQRSAVRRVCSTVHLWVGLALSAALVVVSLTGSALVFRHEIDRALNPALLRAAPGSEHAPLANVVAAVEAAAPESAPRLIRLARAPDAVHEVWLADGRHVYVDPTTATVLGARGDREGAMNTLFALHAELLSGETGEQVVGVVGMLTVLLAATGLVLWWPAAPTWTRVRKALAVERRRGPWRLNYDLHRAGGFYTSAFLVLVAATGAVLVFYAETGALVRAATGVSEPPPPPVAPAGALAPFALDGALQAARSALPSGEPTFVTLPQKSAAPLVVRLRTPSEWHPNGRSYVYLAPASGRVLRTDDARAAPAGERALHAAYPLHIGAFGGAVRLLYIFLGLAPAALSVTGTLVWYRRWRKRDQRMQRERPPAAAGGRQRAGAVKPDRVRLDRRSPPRSV